MKVQDLIELLEAQDPNAEVYLMSQQNWPFEHRIYGVAARADFTEEDVGFEPDDGGDRWGAAEASLPGSDVFIVEGGQTRYGNKAAWDAAQR